MIYARADVMADTFDVHLYQEVAGGDAVPWLRASMLPRFACAIVSTLHDAGLIDEIRYDVLPEDIEMRLRRLCIPMRKDV